MNAIQSYDHFGEPKPPEQDERLGSHECILDLRQQPRNARVAVGKEKDRKPIDPPPIIQLKVRGYDGTSATYLQNPHVFMSCTLLGRDQNDPFPGSLGTSLAGTLVSSLHRLKDLDNIEGCFFLFHDLSVKIEGTYRLRFTLHEIVDNYCYAVKEIISAQFVVHSTKNFPGMAESTFLTRTFADQGMKVRQRKEPRALLRKRGPAHDDYQPRKYTQRTSKNRKSSRQDDAADTTAVSHHQQQLDSNMHERQYSNASHPEPMAYNEPNKRHRTNSEQSQISPMDHQVGALEAVGYSQRYYAEPHQAFGGYSHHPPQTVPYGNSYTATAHPQFPVNDQYLPQALSTTEAPNGYHLQAQRAPLSYYPAAPPPLPLPMPQQFSQPQYTGSILAPSTPDRLGTAHGNYGELGFGREHPVTCGVDVASMSTMAPLYSSMHAPVSTFGPMSTTVPITRDMVESYPSYAAPPPTTLQGYSMGIPSVAHNNPIFRTSGPPENGYRVSMSEF